jgi:hypothetical protein
MFVRVVLVNSKNYTRITHTLLAALSVRPHGDSEVNRSNYGQTNSAGLHGPGTRKRRSRTGPDQNIIGQCEATLLWGPETDERDSSGGIIRPSCICGRGTASNLKIEVHRSRVHDLIVLLRPLSTGVFLLAYFYRRRSIVKAGAVAGGVGRLTGREGDTCKKNVVRSLRGGHYGHLRGTD